MAIITKIIDEDLVVILEKQVDYIIKFQYC